MNEIQTSRCVVCDGPMPASKRRHAKYCSQKCCLNGTAAKAARNRYLRSEKGKEAVARYCQSAEGKAKRQAAMGRFRARQAGGAQ